MMSNKEEIQYGECCCCLEKGDHRELTRQYYVGKQPEIYEVLFKDIFNIVLKYPQNTKLICDICIVELRRAKHFRSMVEISQQRLSDQVNWHPEIIDVREYPLKIESIKCEADNQTEEADNDVQQFECKTEQLNYDVSEIDIKEENTVVDEPSQQKYTVSIKQEPSDNIEDVCTADHQNIQDRSGPSTSSSDKLCITQEKSLQPASVYSQHKNKPFVCDVCSYKTAKKGNLTEHLRIHTGEKPFSCNKCEYKATYKSLIKQHLHIHTGEKPLSCDICDYKAPHKARLTRHLRVHTGEKPFPCNVCQYKTAHKPHLKQHLRIHTGEKPFSCDKCEYKAAQKGHLKQHLLIHTGEKPYSCNICDYRAVHKTHLKQHLRIHTGEKPYSCDICDYRAAQKGHLKQHQLSHTGEKP